MISSRSVRYRSPQTIISVLFIIFSFLAPHYHNHDYSSDYHFDTGDHLEPHHSFEISSGGLSENHKHSSSHLHLKKDFRVEWTRNTIQSRLQKASLYIVKHFDPSYQFIARKCLHFSNESNIQSLFVKVFSGLSPPFC